MPTVNYINSDGVQHEVQVVVGKRIMQAAIAAGIDGILGECGGQAMCATCHVYVAAGWANLLPPMSDEEDELLDDTASPRTQESRLSCQIPVLDKLDGILVRLPDRQV